MSRIAPIVGGSPSQKGDLMEGEHIRGEQRQGISVQVRIETGVEAPQKPHTVIEAELQDISVHGAGLMSSSPLPSETPIEIQIPRTPFSEPKKPPLEGFMKITGRVIYSRPAGGRYRLGISFRMIEDADLLVLQNFIIRKDRRQAPRYPFR